MTIAVSTGLRDAMLNATGLKGALDGGEIRIYSGTPPSSADDAISGDATVLVTILTDVAGGLTFDAPVSGTIAKAAAETWSSDVAVTGTATWYRHVANGDLDNASTTAPRIQGDVSTAGAALNLSSVALVASSPQTIDYYTIGLPTLTM